MLGRIGRRNLLHLHPLSAIRSERQAEYRPIFELLSESLRCLVGQSLWKPSIAADGTIYFVAIDTKGGKGLYSSHYLNGAYQQAQSLSFSDGTTLDVDPEIVPDGSFLVFSSAGRLPGDKKDHLFIVHRLETGGDR